MKIEFEVQPFGFAPVKAHFNDSGWDIYSPIERTLQINERITIDTKVRFKLQFPWYLKFLHLFGLGIRANIQPKSGLSKSGIDVELGEIDEGYRGTVGVTLTNNTKDLYILKIKQKIAQITFTPVFNRIKLKETKVAKDTERGENGFGSSGLK